MPLAEKTATTRPVQKAQTEAMILLGIRPDHQVDVPQILGQLETIAYLVQQAACS